MNKVITVDRVMGFIKSGMSVMIGGFGRVGRPDMLINAILEADIRDLTLITVDSGWEDASVGRLVAERRVKRLISSHIGTNKKSGVLMNAGEMEVELIPQGTLAERIRAAAYGLGGFLTATGIGTAVEEGKEKIMVNDNAYLLELPLTADVGLIYGARVDESGNMTYKGAAVNMNNVMAGAARLTICEAGELIKIGGIEPNSVITPGIFVDYVVKA
ncbi:MAG: 3-oxoacid CoA-transferase subunit A [Defluviitaleaceae bacterium]|nr:3-oxoacid CoA-transferase subunit A [Defluviitaleaceae bacterium]